MREFFKQHISVIIALSIPIALVVVIAFSVYLPSLFFSTQYSFVYATCDGSYDHYYCSDYLKQIYKVEGNRLIYDDSVEITGRYNYPSIESADLQTHLFIYDVDTEESREIDLAEAQGLKLSGLVTSPEGVSFSYLRQRSPDIFFPLDYSSTYGHYLIKGDRKSKLKLIGITDNYYSRNSVDFVGWILE